MGYTDSQGRWVHEDVLTLSGSSAKTTTGNGTAVLLGERRGLSVLLDVTAVSGTTPSATVLVETSNDATTWRTIATFTSATGVTAQRLGVGGADRYVRASWTVAGTTPSLTFSVAGVGV